MPYEDNEKYLVTGAAGQLGNCLQDDWGEDESCAIPRAREAFDISNREHVDEWLPLLKPDAVINCAGYTNVQQAEVDRFDCWQANVLGVQNLARACSKHGIALFHISSDFVFGQDQSRHAGLLKPHDPTRRKSRKDKDPVRTVCYQESDAVGPVGFYGQTKAMAEHVILQEALENPDFQYYIIRTAGLFERPWRQGKNFPYAIASRLLSHKIASLDVVSDVVTNITYVPHLVKAIRWLVENRNDISVEGVTVPTGIYHITNAGVASWFSIAQCLGMAMGFAGCLRGTTQREYCQSCGQRPELSPSFTGLCSSKYEEVKGPALPSWREAIAEWAEAATEYFGGK